MLAHLLTEAVDPVLPGAARPAGRRRTRRRPRTPAWTGPSRSRTRPGPSGSLFRNAWPRCWMATMANGLPVARKSEATEETSVTSASEWLKQSGMSQSFSAWLPQTWDRPVRSASCFEQLLDVAGQPGLARVAIAERVRPEDHRGPAFEQRGDDLGSQRERGVVGGRFAALPGGRVQDGPRRIGGRRMLARLDPLDLRPADDHHLGRGDAYAVGGVALHPLLARPRTPCRRSRAPE